MSVLEIVTQQVRMQSRGPRAREVEGHLGDGRRRRRKEGRNSCNAAAVDAIAVSIAQNQEPGIAITSSCS